MNRSSANLQPTVAQLAKLMNVSERSIYLARKVRRLRPDLVPAIESGELTLNAAIEQVEGKAKPSAWHRLVKAWNAASDEDRARLIAEATESAA